MPIVGWPPILRSGKHLIDVLLHRFKVERFKLLGVVKIVAHRITLGRVLMQHLQVQLVGPPVAVRISLGARHHIGSLPTNLAVLVRRSGGGIALHRGKILNRSRYGALATGRTHIGVPAGCTRCVAVIFCPNRGGDA